MKDKNQYGFSGIPEGVIEELRKQYGLDTVVRVALNPNVILALLMHTSIGLSLWKSFFDSVKEEDNDKSLRIVAAARDYLKGIDTTTTKDGTPGFLFKEGDGDDDNPLGDLFSIFKPGGN